MRVDAIVLVIMLVVILISGCISNENSNPSNIETDTSTLVAQARSLSNQVNLYVQDNYQYNAQSTYLDNQAIYKGQDFQSTLQKLSLDCHSYLQTKPYYILDITSNQSDIGITVVMNTSDYEPVCTIFRDTYLDGQLLNYSTERNQLRYSTIINATNTDCSQTDCSPYITECKEWRVSYYAPAKYCYFDLEKIKNANNIELCKQIERDNLAAQCISLVTASDPARKDCLGFAGQNRTLKAICHLTDWWSQELEINGTINLFNHELEINETGRYYILGNCTGIADGCTTKIWEEP